MRAEKPTDAPVLLIGAAGFIGRRIDRALAATRLSITRTSRTGRSGADPAAALDLANPGTASALVRSLRPAAVVNAAGYGVARDERDPALARRINIEAVLELATALSELAPSLPPWPGPRLIHIGSAFEYGSIPGLVAEDSECRPQSDYAATKLEGTLRLAELCRTTGLRGVTLRVPTVYGPGEHPHRLLPSLILAAKSGGSLPLTAGDQERDFTYVGDVAEGVVRLLHAPAPPWQVANLGTGRLMTVRAFAERARDMLGIPPDRTIFGAVPSRPDEVRQGPLDVSRLEAHLGWRPSTPVDEGIRRTIQESVDGGSGT